MGIAVLILVKCKVGVLYKCMCSIQIYKVIMGQAIIEIATLRPMKKVFPKIMVVPLPWIFHSIMDILVTTFFSFYGKYSVLYFKYLVLFLGQVL